MRTCLSVVWNCTGDRRQCWLLPQRSQPASQPASDGLLAQQQHRRRRLTATSSRLANASQGSSPLHYFRARGGGAAAPAEASRLQETALFLRPSVVVVVVVAPLESRLMLMRCSSWPPFERPFASRQPVRQRPPVSLCAKLELCKEPQRQRFSDIRNNSNNKIFQGKL